MLHSIVNAVLLALGAYLALGALFAAAFVARGAGRIDPDAAEGSWGFRAVVFPGAVALWPVLLVRWVRRPAGSSERSPHRSAAREGGRT